MSHETGSLTKGNIIDGKECAKIILKETKEECDALIKYANVDPLFLMSIHCCCPVVFIKARLKVQSTCQCSLHPNSTHDCVEQLMGV
jgi:hypothetical protein